MKNSLDRLIQIEHDRLGIINDEYTPPPLPPEKQHDGLVFYIPVDTPEKGKVVKVHRILGTWSRRENKRILRKYLAAVGFTNKDDQKRILKEMGFWVKSKLGNKP